MKKIFFVITASLTMTTICHAQANTKLSNLVAPTAVNTNLIPGGGTGTKDIGSNTKRWRNGYFNATVYGYGTGSTYGVYGANASGYGIYGTSGYIGVYGTGTSYGVYGYSSSGYGVTGSSGYIGTYGSGSSYGLYGAGGTYGAYASGSSYGVYGNSSSGYGLAGVSSSSYGVYASGYDGTVGYGSYIGAYGSASSYGLYGNGGTYGAYAYGTSYGVYGSTSGGIGGYFYSASGNGLWTNNNGGAVGSGLYGLVVQSNIYNYGGLYGPSDKNLKKNIADFGDAMSIINKLKPKNYEYRTDDNLTSLNLPKGTHYGLIAQDLEQVLPNLVAIGPKISDKDIHASGMNKAPVKGDQQDATVSNVSGKDAVSYKGVNYIELIPIMIKGMQELSKQNDDLRTQVATLSQTVDLLKKGTVVANASSASINQNFPNPFTKSTVISFSIPQGSSANIIVSQTGSGKVLKSIPVFSGSSQLTFDGASLSAGSYTYSLYIDGKKIDSKQMIINR